MKPLDEQNATELTVTAQVVALNLMRVCDAYNKRPTRQHEADFRGCIAAASIALARLWRIREIELTRGPDTPSPRVG